MKTKALLGFAQAAGKVRGGRTACEQAITSHKAKVLLVATDAARGTSVEFERLAESYGVPVAKPMSMEELGTSIGKAPLAVVCITDYRFARQLLKGVESEQ